MKRAGRRRCRIHGGDESSACRRTGSVRSRTPSSSSRTVAVADPRGLDQRPVSDGPLIVSSPGSGVVDLERRVRRCRSARRAAARARGGCAWQSSPGCTRTWAESDGKPEPISQTCRSWTLVDVRVGGQRAGRSPRRRCPVGRRLEQHAARVAQQAIGGAQHDRGDRQRGDRRRRASQPVARITTPAIAVSDERDEVGEEVLEAALDVHRLAVRLASCRVASRFTPIPTSATTSIARAVGRRAATISRLIALVDDQHGEHEQRDAVRLRGENLGALEAEGEVAAGRPRDEPDHHERQHERAGVGEHVRGVREQRERVREDSGDDLDGHEADDQAERDPQPPGVCVRLDSCE